MMTQRCPACGETLGSDAPQGLCPSCLMAQVALDPLAPTANGVSDRFVPPKPKDIAADFPQLDIIELCGHGGMGAVYRAKQTTLDRVVALKIIHTVSADDPAFAERFTREARAMAQLNHPNIVGVHDFGRSGQLYYLIMEYVDGANLRQLIARGDLKPDEALSIVTQVCEALEYAHSAGVVHRDIKPENVLVDKNGRVKIADFGLAKLIDQPAELHLTQTHQVMGTPNYMSPEQMERPLEVDHRADLYSLGVMLYEMLTGELPIGKFDLPSERASVDGRLDQVVLRSLEKQPERRYQQASEIRTDVESISTGTFRGDDGNGVTDVGGFAIATAIIGTVAFAVWFLRTAVPLWGLLIAWNHLTTFQWSRDGRKTAGVMAILLAIATIAFAVAHVDSHTPMWAMAGIVWFISDFDWFGNKKEEIDESLVQTQLPDDEDEEDGKYTGPVVGLQEQDLQIIKQLKTFTPTSDEGFYVLPNIPDGRLTNARRVCDVPLRERILALFDFTAFGTGSKALLVGCDAIYYLCDEATTANGPVRIPYSMFPSLAIVNGGDHVILDEKHAISIGWSSISCEKLTNVMLSLKQLLAAEKKSK